MTTTHAPTLRPATPDDVPYILACEREPHALPFVTQDSAEAHAAALDDPDRAAFLIELDGRDVGFVLFAGLTDADGNVEFARFVVAERGLGISGAVLALVTDWVFEQTQAHRFWLDVVPHNTTARPRYLAAGFVEEGTLRESWVSSAGRVSLVIMSILRPEWEARRAEPPANRD